MPRKKSIIFTPLQFIQGLIKEIEELVKSGKLTQGMQLPDLVEATIGIAVEETLKINGLTKDYETAEERKDRLLREAYDRAIGAVTLSYWQFSKQVYTFSNDFYHMLCDMEDFELFWDLLRELPYPNFYIEVEDNEVIDGIVIAFDSTVPAIAYTICYKNAKGINCGLIDPRETNSFKSFFDREIKLSNADPNDPHVVKTRQILTFAIQACMYLCSKSPDIQENEKQKEIYRPTSCNMTEMPKNRFSEVRKWDVGIRVVHDHNKAKQEAEEYARAETAAGRKRPRQHWRKAHWHTYWIGQRRKQKIVKFIAPMLINDNGDSTPIVKHL